MKKIDSLFAIEYDKNILIIKNGLEKSVKLPSKIEQIEKFNNAIVVRVNPKSEKFLNENIFGVSYSGEILWQIKAIKHVSQNSPYTGIFKKDKLIKLHNWDGTDLIINPETGDIIKQDYSK